MLLLILKCLFFTIISASTNPPNHARPLVDFSLAYKNISKLDITYHVFSSGEDLGFHHETCIRQVTFDRKLPTKFLVQASHNFSKIFDDVRAAYDQKEKHNVIYVGWSSEFYCPFVLGARNSKIIGEHFGDFIIAGRFDLNKVHLIALGLGSQVTGFAAKSVLKKTGSKILRITALDAVGPKFEGASVDNRLEKNDAQMVDAVHTDGDYYGYRAAFGRVDFFVNGGKDQPGCPPIEDDICSHIRASWYFIESLKKYITAYASKSWDEYLKGEYEENNTATFGDNLDLKTKGTFYFRTKSTPPFLNSNELNSIPY